MFNVRVKYFLDSIQYQIFEHAVASSGERSSKRWDESTGEEITGKEFFYNPFEEKYDYYGHFKESKHSEDSLERSRSRSINMIYDYARSNNWEWFFTLTFDPKKVDRYDYSLCTKKLSQWLNNARKLCPDMVYLVVPEKHKDGAFHFHGLFSCIDDLGLVDSGRRDSSNQVIYNVGKYKLGFSTATRIRERKRASSYITKYITKDLFLATLYKKRYWVSRNALLPQVEDFYLDDCNYLERVQRVLKSDSFIKSCNSEFGSITYVDNPIAFDV